MSFLQLAFSINKDFSFSPKKVPPYTFSPFSLINCDQHETPIRSLSEVIVKYSSSTNVGYYKSSESINNKNSVFI